MQRAKSVRVVTKALLSVIFTVLLLEYLTEVAAIGSQVSFLFGFSHKCTISHNTLFYWLDDSNKKEVTNEILMLISKVFKLKNDQFWNLEVGLDKSILVKQ